MTNLTLRIFSILLLACVGMHAQANNGDQLNMTDEHGNRQGYWIIKGYMAQDPQYAPNLTVEEGPYLNNKKEGLWKRYFPSGKLRSEITYVSNHPMGHYTVYYDNGQVEERGEWVKNKNIGHFERFYPSGTPQQIFEFADNGLRNGKQMYFHDNGQLELEVNVVNGKENGLMIRYYANGSVEEKKTLKNGILEDGSTIHYAQRSKVNQKTAASNVAVEETPAIINKEDSPNEAFIFKPNGYNILYDGNRQITQIGTFKNGRLWDGKWNRYNSDGLLMKIEIYKNGQFVGSGLMEH